MEITAPNSVTCLFLFNSEGKRAANPFRGPHHVLILLQLPCSLGSGAVTGSAEPGGSFPKLSSWGEWGRGGQWGEPPAAGWRRSGPPHSGLGDTGGPARLGPVLSGLPGVERLAGAFGFLARCLVAPGEVLNPRRDRSLPDPTGAAGRAQGDAGRWGVIWGVVG